MGGGNGIGPHKSVEKDIKERKARERESGERAGETGPVFAASYRKIFPVFASQGL
jgi:hypothetical protein